MGESIGDASSDGDKMGERSPSSPVLEVSVSFGRFENDSLSWERWSSFSPNKYLEEVGKCATPGSVAKKKAYFEAHYRKIAARKTELMEQQKQMEGLPITDDNCTDLSEYGNPDGNGVGVGVDSEISVSYGLCSYDGSLGIQSLDKTEVVHVDNDNDNGCDGDGKEESKSERTEDIHETLESSENRILSVEGLEERNDGSSCSRTLDEPEPVFIKDAEEEDSSSEITQEMVEKLRVLKKGKEEETTWAKDGRVPVERPRMLSSKINQVNKKITTSKETDAASRSLKIKKKNVHSVAKPKPPEVFSTPRLSKLVSSSTKMSMSVSTPRTKNASVGESKKVVAKSLHMSRSVDVPGPTSARSPPDPPPPPATARNPTRPTTARKSLIMESMGDKDIVKRAFKTFQNSYNQSRASVDDERSRTLKQVTTKSTSSRITSPNPRKENGGSIKAGCSEKRNIKTPPSTLGLKKTDERVDKRKELSKNLQNSSKTRDAVEKTGIQTKSKDRPTEVKKLSQTQTQTQTRSSLLSRVKNISRPS